MQLLHFFKNVKQCWNKQMWVTVFGRVNQLSTEPGTQAYSAWARPLWLGWNEYMAKAGE